LKRIINNKALKIAGCKTWEKKLKSIQNKTFKFKKDKTL